MKKVKTFVKNNKDIILCTLIPLVIFTFLLLVYYPGIIPFDGNNQWQQVQAGVITNSHPFFSTFFMLLLSKIHNTTTIVLLFQMLAFSITWGLISRQIKTKNKKQEIIKYIFTAIISALPIIGLYMISLWKDILYSIYLLGLSGIILYGLNTNFKYKKYHYVLTGILLTLIASYRHNGILVVIMFFLIIVIGLLIKRKVVTKEILKNYTIIILIFIICMVAISIPKKHYINESKKIVKKETTEQKISIKNKYILWMIEAELKEGKIKNKKDLEFLEKITDIKTFKKTYNPYLINDLSFKNEYDTEFISENEDEILDLLVKYASKYPDVIIIHVLDRDALLINPISQNFTYVYVFSFSEWEYFGFDQVTQSKLPWFRDNVYDRIINISFKGILKYFYQPALILYLSILLLILLSKKVYDRKVYLLGLPMYLNTVSLLPINLAQDLRYAYINYLIFFVILLICIINIKQIVKKNNKKKIKGRKKSRRSV